MAGENEKDGWNEKDSRDLSSFPPLRWTGYWPDEQRLFVMFTPPYYNEEIWDKVPDHVWEKFRTTEQPLTYFEEYIMLVYPSMAINPDTNYLRKTTDHTIFDDITDEDWVYLTPEEGAALKGFAEREARKAKKLKELNEMDPIDRILAQEKLIAIKAVAKIAKDFARLKEAATARVTAEISESGSDAGNWIKREYEAAGQATIRAAAMAIDVASGITSEFPVETEPIDDIHEAAVKAERSSAIAAKMAALDAFNNHVDAAFEAAAILTGTSEHITEETNR